MKGLEGGLKMENGARHQEIQPKDRDRNRDKRVKQKESQFNRSSPYQKFLKRKQVKKKGELSKK